MALAERSQEDVERLVANTVSFTRAVDARNAVPLLDPLVLKEMIYAASRVDVTSIISASGGLEKVESSD